MDEFNQKETESDVRGFSTSAENGMQFGRIEGQELTLVGRNEPLAQLESAKNEFLANNKTSIVLLRGVSGAGKSSLLSKFLGREREEKQFVVVGGQSYQRTSGPFQTITSLIESLIQFLNTQPEEDLNRMLPEGIQFLTYQFPEMRRVSRVAEVSDQDLFEGDPKELKQHAFSSFAELLNNVASVCNLLLSIDDLHWADKDDIEFLSDFLNSASTRVLILGCISNDESELDSVAKKWNQLALDVGHQFQVVDIQPLTEEGCRQMVENRTSVPASTIQKKHFHSIFHQSGGVPYDIKLLAESLKGDGAEFRLLTITDMIYSRLSKLPYQATSLLKLVAAAGRPVLIDELSEAAGFDTVQFDTVDQMQKESLVRLHGGVESVDDSKESSKKELCFVDAAHERIRRTVNRGIPANQRIELHIALGETIEKREAIDEVRLLDFFANSPITGEYRDLDCDRIFDLSFHFTEANEARAWLYQLLAAEQALIRCAINDALARYKLVTAGIRPEASGVLKSRAWHGAGQAFRLNGLADEAEQAFEQGRRFCN